MTQEEVRAQYKSVIERKGGSERLVEMWLGQVERYVGGGIAKGTVACFENEFFGFCHCGEKDSFVCLGIPEEEREVFYSVLTRMEERAKSALSQEGEQK